jgi:hypothetical protein
LYGRGRPVDLNGRERHAIIGRPGIRVVLDERVGTVDEDIEVIGEPIFLQVTWREVRHFTPRSNENEVRSGGNFRDFVRNPTEMAKPYSRDLMATEMLSFGAMTHDWNVVFV